MSLLIAGGTTLQPSGYLPSLESTRHEDEIVASTRYARHC